MEKLLLVLSLALAATLVCSREYRSTFSSSRILPAGSVRRIRRAPVSPCSYRVSVPRVSRAKAVPSQAANQSADNNRQE